MLDRDTRQALVPLGQAEGDGEGWLMSYLDVLTLLITLFVLLLSMASYGLPADGADAARQISPSARQAALRLVEGLQPRHQGLQPRFQGLQIEGVSVEANDSGVTLRIEDRLLFSSGRANLTGDGRQVLGRLAERLGDFTGHISVEGHTDSLPIATSRFPSNWELSTGRASAVVRYLAEAGVPRGRLRAIGYADTQPLAGNDSPEGRAANRRVELLLRQGPDQG
ncbi:OmpA/MotB family protein [Halomonas nitroreducens]|uniref:Flagellar motor protein MotB n=1 Tax=Halomonas nitroreducens TaxID=447425 RepID=A0A3S0JWV2_9GAMM|nr:OmpA family protein [Halomonas nitroreducens]RTR04446.1 flagellar motor protein MotB [Halomonas nitroreducens]